ncbi:MAG: glycosyltransferase family 2 protein [Bacillota bacterium]
MGCVVSVIIPAYNESSAVASTIAAAKASTGDVSEVLVVDDGSTDDTAWEARKAGAGVLRLERRSGKGAALGEGIKQVKGDIVVFLDADVGDKASEIRRLIEPVAAGEADMVVARFPRSSGKAGGFGIVKSVAAFGIRRLCGMRMTAPLSGQRAARREVFLALAPFAAGFGVEVALTIDAVRCGYRVVEKDCMMAHRETGRDVAGFLHRARQLYWVIKAFAGRCSPPRAKRLP